jgi:aldose 1-epimerase
MVLGELMMKITNNIEKTVIGDVNFITIENDNGLKVTLTTYGAAVYSLQFKDQKGNYIERSVRPSNIDEFMTSTHYYGKTVGRVSGRIMAPGYYINDQFYEVKPFGGLNSKLHGGAHGFSFKHFHVEEIIEETDQVKVIFSMYSPHMEEDFPGKIHFFVTYVVTNKNGLEIYYNAKSTEDTLFNVMNHLYFNLSGKHTIHHHKLCVLANQYHDIDVDFNGKGLKSVEHSVFDFRTLTSLEERMKEQMKTDFLGFDHTFLLNHHTIDDEVVVLEDDETKTKLSVYTTYPAVVIYTHNQKSPSTLEPQFHDGMYSALTLECQYEPGGIHYPYLNHAILKKDEPYQHIIKYIFSSLK